jgi:hypothetical protein
MHRIQVQLTAEQERTLRELAALRGSSISALIRDGIDSIVAPARAEREARKERFRSIIGRFSSGPRDVASRHDDYLADDIAERKAGRRTNVTS